MKIGISSYCLHPSLQSGEWDIQRTIEWIKEQGASHVEIVPIGIPLEDNPQLASTIRAAAESVGLGIANYAVSGDVTSVNPNDYQAEIARLKRQVDLAAELGASLMRHDIVPWGYKSKQPGQFEKDFNRFVEACGVISEYAHQYGITTMIENHGNYVVASDRVIRLVQEVNRPNFRMLLDIGNFLCVDEDPIAAVNYSLPYAALIHFKDFYIRKPYEFPGEEWLKTLNGKYIRGAIFGHGDLEIRYLLGQIKQSAFEGPISIEFEGLESDQLGTRLSFANAVRLWEEA